MSFTFRKFLFVILFNTSLFLMLILGIQNSSEKTNVNFLFRKSANLPISFVIGTSFIIGSIFGNMLPKSLLNKK